MSFREAHDEIVRQILRGSDPVRRAYGPRDPTPRDPEDLDLRTAARMACMDTPEDFCGPLNLGHPEEFSIRELADLVVEMTGSKSKIVSKTLPCDDPRQRCPDISLAKKELKWSPSIELREGLAKTIPYFVELLRKA